MGTGRSWLWGVPVCLMLLALAGAAAAITLTRQGGKITVVTCPGLVVTKAEIRGADRAYVWEGACAVELDAGPSLVSVKARVTFDAEGQKAAEEITGAGPGVGPFKIQTVRRGCASDPFVSGAGPCTGASSMAVDEGWPPFLQATGAPLMAGRVPPNQAYETVHLAPTSPPPGAGQVRITKPADRQSFVFGDKLSIEVRFTPANFTHPPEGGVGLQWGRETSIGTCTFDVGYLGVGHYSMAQMLGKGAFPSPGRYCLRATSKPGVGPVSTWKDWSDPVRIVIGERVAAKSPASGSSGASAAGGKAMEKNAGKAIPRLPGSVLDDATRQLQGLEGRLLRLGSNADAARLLGDIRAYRARLGEEPDLAALQTRLRELTAQVEGLESSVKKIPSISPKATAEPSTTPKIGSQ